MPDSKLTTEDMLRVAKNLRQMCSDPALKRNFPSALRKLMNDAATGINDSLRGDLDRSVPTYPVGQHRLATISKATITPDKNKSV